MEVVTSDSCSSGILLLSSDQTLIGIWGLGIQVRVVVHYNILYTLGITVINHGAPHIISVYCFFWYGVRCHVACYGANMCGLEHMVQEFVHSFHNAIPRDPT